jgi:hypothetical protein
MSDATIYTILAGSELAGDFFLLLGCSAVASLLISEFWRKRK